MTSEFVVGIGRQAVETVLLLSAPMLIVALVTGLLISIFQAATQINEQTMTFIPKIVAVLLTLLIYLTALTTLWSGIVYMGKWGRQALQRRRRRDA